MYRPIYVPECSMLCFSPDLEPPEDLFAGERNVFVCGALQEPARMSTLLGLEVPFAPAAAAGYRRSVERINGQDVPFMIPDGESPHSILTGVVWLDLSEASFRRIEGVELEGGFRRRISLEVQVGELKLTAWSYIKK